MNWSECNTGLAAERMGDLLWVPHAAGMKTGWPSLATLFEFRLTLAATLVSASL